MPLLRRAIPLVLAAALAVSARAGVVAPAGPVFAPPAGAWAGPLGLAFADPAASAFLPPALGSLSLSSPEALRAAAPLVQSLSQALSVTPEAFAAMTPVERKSAVELAAEEAKDTVRAKAYELSETARALAKPGRSMDKEGRAELYATVSRLMEMREHYGAWLDEGGQAAVDDGYQIASRTAWEVRTFLLKRDADPVVERERAPRRQETAAPAKPVYVLAPSGTARKLREDMENNKSGWGQSDLDTLYTGYGFELRQGGKHRMYYHPAFPQLHQSVSRQNDLPPGYAQSALKLLVELERLTAEQTKTAAAPATGPPATLNLADLSILLSQPREKTRKAEPAAEAARLRNSPAPARVASRAAPREEAAERPAPPRITARLAPAEPVAPAPKAEPPPVEAAPAKRPGLIERLKLTWGSIKGKTN